MYLKVILIRKKFTTCLDIPQWRLQTGCMCYRFNRDILRILFKCSYLSTILISSPDTKFKLLDEYLPLLELLFLNKMSIKRFRIFTAKNIELSIQLHQTSLTIGDQEWSPWKNTSEGASWLKLLPSQVHFQRWKGFLHDEPFEQVPSVSALSKIEGAFAWQTFWAGTFRVLDMSVAKAAWDFGVSGTAVAELWAASNSASRTGSMFLSPSSGGCMKVTQRPCGPTPVVTAGGLIFGRVAQIQWQFGKNGHFTVIAPVGHVYKITVKLSMKNDDSPQRCFASAGVSWSGPLGGV
jgi:hypothetical protein